MLLRKYFSIPALCIGLIAFLAVFLKFYEPGLGYSSSTYGAFAKSLLANSTWFHPFLGPRLFDPFVDHPYLVLWLDAFVFYLFGASAQTVRVVASLSGIGVLLCLFFSVRKNGGELAAFLACLCLLFINEFMHFASSGWLDMPMIGFVWCGFLCVASTTKKNCWSSFFGGVSLGCAVISKGASALAVIPILIWTFTWGWRERQQIFMVLFGFMLPITMFTALHFRSEHFFFWKTYFLSQNSQNKYNEQLSSYKNLFWYIQDIFRYGHVVTVLGIAGLRSLYRSGYKTWAVLIASELLIHIAAYSFGWRHYGQYVIPVFPWLAWSAGYFLAQQFPKIHVERLAFSCLLIALIAFVLLDLLPVQVHSGANHPFRSFQSSLALLHDNKRVYFFGDLNQQPTWEDLASDIPWYWQREPNIADSQAIFTKLERDDTKALGLWPYKIFVEQVASQLTNHPQVKRCLWNEDYVIIANKEICSEDFQALRPLSQ